VNYTHVDPDPLVRVSRAKLGRTSPRDGQTLHRAGNIDLPQTLCDNPPIIARGRSAAYPDFLMHIPANSLAITVWP